MAKKQVYHCALCGDLIKDIQHYADHMESDHNDQIIKGMTPRQFIDYLIKHRVSMNCGVCKAPTSWNEKLNRYNYFCDNPQCKIEYRMQFERRMIGIHGKVNLLDDPEQQRKMLANRSISGIYRWFNNPRYQFTYTGTFERDFFIFLDRDLDADPKEVFSPSPHTYYYNYEGKKHFYIPDLFIAQYGVEIEIKDGGTNPNMHPKIQAVDKVKEKLKDEVMTSRGIPFDYVKIINRDHRRFLEYLELVKERDMNNSNERIILL